MLAQRAVSRPVTLRNALSRCKAQERPTMSNKELEALIGQIDSGLNNPELKYRRRKGAPLNAVQVAKIAKLKIYRKHLATIAKAPSAEKAVAFIIAEKLPVKRFIKIGTNKKPPSTDIVILKVSEWYNQLVQRALSTLPGGPTDNPPKEDKPPRPKPRTKGAN
jgi:hypothetical protein